MWYSVRAMDGLHLRRSWNEFQDKAYLLLGSTPEARGTLVAGLLKRDVSEAATYWLQLVVSVGIATMGLVLGSAAVVIGAMLVAPLMGPILTLGMGLAAGSPFLVLRSAGRVALSVVVVIAASCLITLALPFHEVNAELAARTSPTVLDLVTAAFCALAGVYSVLRPGSDTATTAAGTSIGISLVPPLCASGFGFGTSDPRIAGGAALLFLTNFVAIVAVSTVGFVLVGFNRVNVVSLEADELSVGGSDAPLARSLARRLSTLFSSRLGPLFRILMPFVLLASVYVPLRRALDEVAWQVRVRAAVERELGKVSQPVVRSQILIERGQVQGAVVLLGSMNDASLVKQALEASLEAAAGVRPRLSVTAVPDATAFAGLQSTLQARAAAAPLLVPPPRPSEQLDEVFSVVQKAVEERWPSRSAGTPLRVFSGLDGEVLEVTITHQGVPLSAAAREAVEKALAGDLARSVRVLEEPIPSELSSQAAAEDPVFVASLRTALGPARRAGLNVCAAAPFRPEASGRNKPDLRLSAFDALVGASIGAGGAIRQGASDRWNVTFSASPCAAPNPDASAPDAGAESLAP